MIDTDRYEGHTEGPWKVIEKANDYQTTDVVVGKTIVASNVSPSDSALIADAPLLLEEVKQLRGVIECMRFDIEYIIDHPWPSLKHLKEYLKEIMKDELRELIE